MKKIIYIFILIILSISLVPINISNANDNEETINEQQEEFGINRFIKESKQYTGEFFENIDIGTVLNDAIKGEVDNSTIFKKILSLLRKRSNSWSKSYSKCIGCSCNT